MNTEQQHRSEVLFGKPVVDMLFRVHEDAKWIIENIGVGCTQPEILEAFKSQDKDGLVLFHEGRIYLDKSLIEGLLKTVPGISEFFVPRNALFIGGTAPYIYDDVAGKGGKIPTAKDVEKIARIAQASDIVSGMGRGVKLKDEVEQMEVMAKHCQKPLYVAATSDAAISRAQALYLDRGNIMVVFCLTRPPLQVNENFSHAFVKVVEKGIPVFISAMPMAGISAPYSYNGVLAMTHAEVLFGICASQALNPGAVVVHGGFPTIADPAQDYNPDYGKVSHQVLNLLMAHLNMILDLPTIQSGGTTNEEHPSVKALEDARTGLAMAKKYGFHMLRHPFGFLKQLVDFSFEKFEKAIDIAASVSSDQAPELTIPGYDEKGFESIQQRQLDMYMDDPLTTANMGRIFTS